MLTNLLKSSTGVLVLLGALSTNVLSSERIDELMNIGDITPVKSCAFNQNVADAHRLMRSVYSNYGEDYDARYAKIQQLLGSVSGTELNCNPKLYNENESLLAMAVSRDLRIVEFLLDKGADPLDNHQLPFEDLYFKNTDTYPDYLKKMRNPLGLAYEVKTGEWKNTKDRQPNDESNGQKIWNLLSEVALKTYGKELEEHCYKNFKSLFQEIQNAHTEAQKANKRLMILLSEGHGEISSLLIELMAYQIAHKSLKINTVLEEMDQLMLDSYQKFGYTPTRQFAWTTVVEFLNTIAESNPKIIPIDINQYKYASRPVNDPGDVKERNDTMAEESNKINENVLSIVGEAHFEGLLNDTDLIEKFHVLPIATVGSLNRATKTSKEVKYFVELKNYEMFFAPKIIKHMYAQFSRWIEDL